MDLDLQPGAAEEMDLQPGAAKELDLQPGAAGELDLQPGSTEGPEPGGTLGKARMAAAAGAAQAVAGFGSGLKALSDIGPAKPSFARHEAAALRAGEEQVPYDQAMAELMGERSQRRERLMLPGATIEATAGTAAAQAKEAAGAMEGNDLVAKGAELVGGMVPYLLTGPGAPVAAGVSSYGTTFNQAQDFYRKQGLSEDEARAKAEKIAASTGLATGEIFAALPGFGKTIAEKMLAKQLQAASPLVRGAVSTLAASAQGSLVMGADSLVRNAQAKQTYRPDLSWSQVLEEAAKDALAGGAATAVVHGPMELLKGGAGTITRTRTTTRTTEEPPLEGPSEFGGEAEMPPPSGQPGVEKAAPGANAAQVSQPTVPESAETLESQVKWLEQGNREAVLVTPGAPAVRVPEGMATKETKAGTFIYNPNYLTGEAIDQAVEGNKVGELLGYGIAAKPAAGTEMGVVVVRGPDGTEKQAVVTDEKNVGQALEAARAVAGPGDTVGLESGAKVIKERQDNATRVWDKSGGVLEQREAGNESGQAATAGGGDRLRGEAEGAAGQAEAPKVKARRGTTLGSERGWDLIDEIEANLGGKISLKAARAVDPDFNPRGAARKLFAASGHWGVDDAMGAAEGFRRYESMDEFLTALQGAADKRVGDREGQRQEAQVAQADEAREAEFTRDAKRPRPEGEPVMPEELMPGDTFMLNGTKMKVKGFEFDENSEVTHVRLDDGDRYGTQRWPAREEIHADKGSVESKGEAEFVPGLKEEVGGPVDVARKLAYLDTQAGTEVAKQYGTDAATTAISNEAYQQGELFAGPEGAGVLPGQSAGSGPDTGAGRLRQNDLARAALRTLTPEALRAALARRRKISSIEPRRAPLEIPEFRINGTVIKTPVDFVRTLIGLRSPYVETLKVALVDKDSRVIHSQVLYAGTLDTTALDARDLLRLKELHPEAVGVLMSHNHPSGDPSPSDADLHVTAAWEKQAAAAGLKLVDHVITDGEKYYSWVDQAVKELPDPKLAPWEKMPRGELIKVDDETSFAWLVKTLRQVNNDTAHIIYLTTRSTVSAIERVRPEVGAIGEALLKGVGVEGARNVLVDFGPSIEHHDAWTATQKFNRSLMGSTTKVLDFAAQQVMIGRAMGWYLGEEPPRFEAGQVLREEPADEERQTGVKIGASAAISDQVKGAITEYLYRPRTNAGDDALAAGIVRDLGVNAAEQALRDPPASLPGAVWSRLLGQVTRTLAEQERVARQAKDEPSAQALAERQAKLWDDMLPRITELAQSLQGLNDLVDMSPEGQVARVRRDLDRANREALDRKQPELVQMKAALDQGKQEGVEQVRRDPNVNAAAGKAVDAAVDSSPRIQQAVLATLIEAWKSAKADLQGIGIKGETAAEVLKGAAKERMAQAARIFASHLNGEQPAVALVDKLMQGLGLTRDKAVDLANKLNGRWEEQLAKAKAQVPRQITQARQARVAGAEPVSPDSPTAAVDAAIRAELKGWNQKLGNVLRMEMGRQDATSEHVAERIVQASGLQGEAADTLRNVLKNRWNALVTEAQVKALERMEKASGVKTSRPLRSAFEKLVELERLGALTGDRFLEVVRRQLKLKELTQEQAGILRSLVRRAQDRPEGFLRQQAAADVLKFTEKLKGAVSWRDVPMAIFYANVLSGFTTPAKIMLENANLLASSTVAALASRPRNLLHPVEWLTSTVDAYRRGLAKGALQAAGTLKTGTVTGVWAEPRTSVLEMKPFGERMDVFNFWKYFGRVIGTAHELTFKPSWEVKQAELARDVAAREGLSGRALTQRVADLLANTEGETARARGQALTELQALGRVSAVDLARRSREILEQRREEQMPGSTAIARDYALRMSYLNEPYGFLGGMATGMRSLLEQLRRKFPVTGTAAKTQIPFTTVVANILNEKLNWTPVGLVRAALSHKSGELYGRPILSGNERAEAYAKAVLGTIAIGAMWELFGSHIHGNGPSDPHKRRQLAATGWIPHSIDVNGRYYSFMNTPAAVGLAVIGNTMDWQRYGKGDNAETVTRCAFALKATVNAIVSQGMLDSLKRIFEVLGSESTTEGADKLEKAAARTASSFVFPNLVQQVDRIFDPTVYDKTGTEALIKGQIPFVRREGKPALTVLGDPVEVDPFHYWTSTLTKDVVMQMLAEKQAWIPEPSRQQQFVGDNKRGPDYSRAMTPDEFYDFVQESGKAIRERLEANLDRIALAEPEEARRLVQRIAEEERAKVKPRF
jgi:hypothetical protein